MRLFATKTNIITSLQVTAPQMVSFRYFQYAAAQTV